jgi:hypothetical protein
VVGNYSYVLNAPLHLRPSQMLLILVQQGKQSDCENNRQGEEHCRAHVYCPYGATGHGFASL